MSTNPNDVFTPLDMENNTSSPSGNDTPLEAPTPAFAASSAGQQEPFDPSSTRTSFTRVDHDHDGVDEQGLLPPLPTLTHISSSSMTPGASSDPESTVPADNVAAKASSLSSSQPPQPALTSPPPAAPSSSTMPEIQTHPASPAPAPTSTPTPESASASASIPIPAPTPQVASAPVPAVPQVPQTPQTYLTFLLISGKRRTMAFDPETAIGRVKELAWNSWPADWQDDRPPAPSYLRVLYLGRMLQDDETLTKLKLPTYTPPTSSPSPSASSSPSSTNSPGQTAQQQGPTPTIMHLSIRPYAPPNEGDGAFKKKRRRGTEDGSPSSGTNPNDTQGGQEAGCCRCVVC